MTTATATIASPATVKVARQRRKPLPGEVNITNDKAARAHLDVIRAEKVIEREGAAAKRRRVVSEEALRNVMGAGKVLVIGGQPVAKVSSPRSTKKVDFDLLLTAYPEAYAAVVSLVEYDYLEV